VSRAVHFTLRARKQIAAASAWWLEHRDKAPEAFLEDFQETLASISMTPGIGIPVPSRRPGIRRVFLDRLRYYLYYRIRLDGDIDVVAIWHASRGAQPRL